MLWRRGNAHLMPYLLGRLKRMDSVVVDTLGRPHGAEPAEASMMSLTTAGGADAPAVRPIVDTPASQLELDVVRAVDQVGGGARPLGGLHQPHRVRGVRRAGHQDQVGLGGDGPDRLLAVGRGVADVVAARRRGPPGTGRSSALGDLRRPRPRPAWSASGRRPCPGRAAAATATSSAVCDQRRSSPGPRPAVPSTSSWPAWPISATRLPSSANRRASACTLATSGQVASTTVRPRRSASSRTAGRDAVRGEHDRARRPAPRRARPRRPRRAAPGRPPRGCCARSACARRPAAPWRSSARSTISMARSTPAQNERGPASSTCRGPRAGRPAVQHRAGARAASAARRSRR